MSQQQPEDPEITASFFGSWLLEASESQLQEFIDMAPQWLSNQPLALLSEFKALVNARLAAEPKKKVILSSNPHDVRVSYWEEIAKKFEAEINYRSIRSEENATEEAANNRLRPGAKEDPTVAARRTIVRQNTDVSDEELCHTLDYAKIGVPIRWKDAGVETWATAWAKHKRRIHVLFSKDRKSN
jgi:hypothetical protein